MLQLLQLLHTVSFVVVAPLIEHQRNHAPSAEIDNYYDITTTAIGICLPVDLSVCLSVCMLLLSYLLSQTSTVAGVLHSVMVVIKLVVESVHMPTLTP